MSASLQGYKVRLTVKNISRTPLKVSDDELTERFVRGDASRSTEGSGLGLNIAASLVKLQKGAFRLTVDGDLFKARMVFAGFAAQKYRLCQFLRQRRYFFGFMVSVLSRPR